jgi:signal transduction histidine kinase
MGRPSSFFGILAALAVFAILLWVSLARPAPAIGPLPVAIFGGLLVFTQAFSLPAGGGRISLVPMTVLAAYLVMGLVPAGWTVFLATFVHHGVQNALEGRQPETAGGPGRLETLSLAAAHAATQTLALVVAGALYEAAGGPVPLMALSADVQPVPQLFLLGVSYLSIDHGLAALAEAGRGRRPLTRYGQSLPDRLLYEGAPLVFAPLTALIYTGLGPAELIRFSALLVVATLLVRDLGLASHRLQQRLVELDSLQSMGQILSASLDLEAILGAIYSAAARLMPMDVFYVALYDEVNREISFPLVMQRNTPAHWPARPASVGHTEYLLSAREPLLLRRNAEAELQRLGLQTEAPAAGAWLGVPMLAGGQPVGAIVVQSAANGEVYTQAHRELLGSIAAQAAVALQNARLYARTDAALARRVRELDSILQTADEGILLTDLQWRVLAVNRALAAFTGLAQADFSGSILAPRPGRAPPLVELLGYTAAGLEADGRDLLRGDQPARKQEISLPGPPARHLARTLAPVRDHDAGVIGWLLVFRDLTEERELAGLRDDLTHMLVHDLRAPAAVLKGSLDMFRVLLRDGNLEELERLVSTAREGTDRLLKLINELLDISRLESGQVEVQTEPLDSAALLRDVAGRLQPLATSGQVAVDVDAGADLPPLDVDPELIGRVVTNLLDNAIKFTPPGGTIRLWARAANGLDGPGVLVGVSDQGPGIPREAQGRLFKKFEHVNASRRRTGTGLGLAFCKLAVEAHGGRIWIESEPGQGASFVMRLPVAAYRI